MAHFGDPKYWEARFETTRPLRTASEWYGSFKDLEASLKDVLTLNKSVLIIGPGASRLPQDIYDSGVHNVVCVDTSSCLVDHQQVENLHKRAGLRYHCCDAVEGFHFKNTGFDVVIDKGTLDCVLCREDGVEASRQMVQNIYDVLLPRGMFWVASHAEPNRRDNIFNCCPWEKYPVTQFQSSSFESILRQEQSKQFSQQGKEFFIYKFRKPGTIDARVLME